MNYPDVPFPEAGIADLKTADDRADIYLRETTTSALSRPELVQNQLTSV